MREIAMDARGARHGYWPRKLGGMEVGVRSRLPRHAIAIGLMTSFATLGATCDPRSPTGWAPSSDSYMDEVDRTWRQYEGFWCEIGRIAGGFVPLNPTLFSELGCALGDLISRVGELFPTRETTDAVASAADAYDRYVEAAGRALRSVETSAAELERESDRGALSREDFEERMRELRRRRDALDANQRTADGTVDALDQIRAAAARDRGGAKGVSGSDPADLARLDAEANELDRLVAKSRAQLAASPALAP